jgi:hypothetical protein
MPHPMSQPPTRLRPIGTVAAEMHDLQARFDRLEADKKSLEIRCATLKTAMERIVAVDETVTYLVVGTTLHACSSTGKVQRLVSVGTFTETDTTFAMQWQDAPPVAGSVAEIVEGALRQPSGEMDVIDGEAA